jgi:hypothetical protein
MNFREVNLDLTHIPDTTTNGRKSKFSRIELSTFEANLIADSPLIFSMKEMNFLDGIYFYSFYCYLFIFN